MARLQRGWIRVEKRSQGKTWVLRYNAIRESEGERKRVERTVAIGLLRDFPHKSDAWAEVERLTLTSKSTSRTFAVACCSPISRFTTRNTNWTTDASITPLAATTMSTYRLILKNYLIPRWGKRIALGIEPLEMKSGCTLCGRRGWNGRPSTDQRTMSSVYQHGQRHKLIPRETKRIL